MSGINTAQKIRLIVLMVFTLVLGGYTYLNGPLLNYFLIIWVLISHFVAEAAEKKNRNYFSFLILSIFASPLLMGIIVAVIAKPDRN